MLFSELCKPTQHRYSVVNIPDGVTLQVHPFDVTLDLRSQPACTDAIDRRRLNEIAFEHNNLRSEIPNRSPSCAEADSLCARISPDCPNWRGSDARRPHNAIRHKTWIL